MYCIYMSYIIVFPFCSIITKITSKQLTSDLEKYFDGLNDVRKDNNIDQKATATISKTQQKKSTAFFEGKLATYDHFATNKRFTLNVKIESHFCKKTRKTSILFKFSPRTIMISPRGNNGHQVSTVASFSISYALKGVFHKF